MVMVMVNVDLYSACVDSRIGLLLVHTVCTVNTSVCVATVAVVAAAMGSYNLDVGPRSSLFRPEFNRPHQ